VELIAEGLYAVTRYQPQFDKIMRSRRCHRQRLPRQAKLCCAESMHAQTAMIENGFVHLPDAEPWLAPYLYELSAFPNGRHDDQVDSTAQMLEWFKQAGSGLPTTNAGIFEYYRQLAEKTRGQQARRDARVRLRVPCGIGRMNMLLLNVAADGTSEMLENETESFLRAGWERVEEPASTK